jgi:hypothetical protein
MMSVYTSVDTIGCICTSEPINPLEAIRIPPIVNAMIPNPKSTDAQILEAGLNI